MPKYMTHFAFFFLALTALSGVWMRLFALTENAQSIPYDHLLHAHSHAAVLGWTFLAVLIVYIKITWQHLQQKKQAITLVLTTFLVTTFMFLAFLWQGYALYSIILSTAHILVEYWAIFFIYRSLKDIPDMPLISKSFIKGSLFTLFISSIGPWSLGAIASQGLQELPIFDMAIYFYLHFQYNGWLYLVLAGIFLYLIVKKGITVPTKLLKISFGLYIVALFPSYLLSVLWYDFGTIGVVFAAIGAIGQLVSVLILCYTVFQIRLRLKETISKRMNILLWFILSLLITKSIMELALLNIPLATLIYDTRAVVIGYLHLTLLGFISLFIIHLFQIGQVLDENNATVKWGLTIFITGFIINELVLFTSGLFTWLDINRLPFENELLLFAAILLSFGTLFMWSNVFMRENVQVIEKRVCKKAN